MIERFSRIAERAATSASRRQFLGRVGKGALAAAGVVASYLAVGPQAEAAKRCTTDANCRRGYICVAGKCIQGVRSSVCGIVSDPRCVGKTQGAWCPAGTRSGVCVGVPACICFVRNGGRGGR
jgi:hypothetical protein